MTVERLSDRSVREWLDVCARNPPTVNRSLTVHALQMALTELQHLRAAKAADRERVMEVVRIELDKWTMAPFVDRSTIATRVADALAVPGQAALTADERTELREILAERWMDDYAAGRSAIERLLIDLAPAQIGLSDGDRQMIGRALEFMSNYYHDVDRDQITQIWRRLSR